ncbi:hypothetical protein Q3G72_011488 [Acer saccharum]|nr:hypothetical protein Q3G72_011488 [Acer saccharum]
MIMPIRSWKSFLEFFIFLYFAYLLAAAARYDDYPSALLFASWTTYDLPALKIIQGSEFTMRIILFKIVPNPSSNIGFAFGFVSYQPSSSTFLGAASVRLASNSDLYGRDFEVFWLANRNKPVHENATLQLQKNGDLILRDVDGTSAWSTNTSNMSVAGLKMLDTGNLVLYGDNNKTLWQAFDHPTDTLLPGQILMAGQKLVSRASATDLTGGSFYLSVSYEGLFAFYRSTVPQMYFNLSVNATMESEQPSYIRAVNGTLALYILSAEPSEPDAVLSSPVNYSENAYMRLDSDGHLRFYNGSIDDYVDAVDILADVLRECDYPTVCGNFGLCSYGHCTCPPGFDQDNVLDNQSKFGCKEINPVTCENGQSQSLTLLKDVYYFNYVDPDAADLKEIHMDSCKDACLRNCSCKVAMFQFQYSTSHGICFLLSHSLSLINEGLGRRPYNSYAFIKLPKEQESQRLSSVSAPPIRAIAGITVGTFALVVLVVGFCILCIRKKKNMDGDVEDEFDQLSGMPVRFSYEELKLATEDFQRKLGEGGFGSVFEGTLVSGEKVAAKRLDGLGQGKKEFLAEVKTIGSIHHINLVRLIGFCAEKLHRLLVEDMQLHGEEVVQMMRVAVWCLQNDYNRRPSMSTVVKVLEGTMEFEASLTAITRELEEQFGDTTSALLPSILSGPR